MKVVLDTNCLVNVIMPGSYNCAIIAGATYIVSNDRHFQELSHYEFPKVDVRSLLEFLDIVRRL